MRNTHRNPWKFTCKESGFLKKIILPAEAEQMPLQAFILRREEHAVPAYPADGSARMGNTKM